MGRIIGSPILPLRTSHRVARTLLTEGKTTEKVACPLFLLFLLYIVAFLFAGTVTVSADPAGTPVPGNLVVNGSFEDAPGADDTIFPAVVVGWQETTGCGFEV